MSVNSILTTRVSERGKRVMKRKGRCKLLGGAILKGLFSGLTGILTILSIPPTSSRAYDRRPARAPVRFRVPGFGSDNCLGFGLG